MNIDYEDGGNIQNEMLDFDRDYTFYGAANLCSFLSSKYPNILKDESIGAVATDLFNDAQILLEKLINENLLKQKKK